MDVSRDFVILPAVNASRQMKLLSVYDADEILEYLVFPVLNFQNDRLLVCMGVLFGTSLRRKRSCAKSFFLILAARLKRP